MRKQFTGDTRSNLSTFLYSTDNGVSWTFGNGTFQSDANVGAFGLKFITSDNTTLYCMGYVDILMKTTDGINWNVVTSIPNNLNEPVSIASNGEGDILITGLSYNLNGLVVSISIDDGTSFQNMQNLPTNAYEAYVFYTQDIFYLYVLGGTSSTMYMFNMETQNVNDITDFNNWNDITPNFTDSSNNPSFIGGGGILMFYENDTAFVRMTNYDTPSQHVLYSSTDGENFQEVTGLGGNEKVNQIRYNSTNSTYYACVSQLDSSQSIDYLMYSSSDGTSWTGIISSDNFITETATQGVEGIRDFVVEANGFKLFTSYNIYDVNYSVGFINTDLTGIALDSSDPIVLIEMYLNKIFLYNNYILTIFSQSDTSNGNTIFYQGPNDTTLQETEHQDDTN